MRRSGFITMLCWYLLMIALHPHVLGCEQITKRREIHQLSDVERINFINALKELKESGEYDRLTKLHVLAFKNVHGKPSFFPWHRKSLREFELALQQIDPSLAVPYWVSDHDVLRQSIISNRLLRTGLWIHKHQRPARYLNGLGETESRLVTVLMISH
ncbi:Di-copper centre-containing protein [Basidiobolus meristosporus CBS 931.73]|uniref:Di-copper centre-containing protein n=1 Tax=Basidiobolus meristosporus CBS 931.73 TaxID=1314790 RepID=A0A1Y1YF00_9FUNG|nr:Di-copper centre-containing protein [Basidiobolus meristosporus CBS 931.73]|eukprot:ORX96582.1 Di-copper centre-containing protein [Basidiobolus meristosporus CBS 931.73]